MRTKTWAMTETEDQEGDRMVEYLVVPRKPFILHVEDDGAFATIFENAVGERLGIVRVGTVKEALQFLSEGERNVGAVVLDLNLPDADGMISVIEIARAAGRIPIIVLTSGDLSIIGKRVVANSIEGAFDKTPEGVKEAADRAVKLATEYLESGKHIDRTPITLDQLIAEARAIADS